MCSLRIFNERDRHSQSALRLRVSLLQYCIHSIERGSSAEYCLLVFSFCHAPRLVFTPFRSSLSFSHRDFPSLQSQLCRCIQGTHCTLLVFNVMEPLCNFAEIAIGIGHEFLLHVRRSTYTCIISSAILIIMLQSSTSLL